MLSEIVYMLVLQPLAMGVQDMGRGGEALDHALSC